MRNYIRAELYRLRHKRSLSLFIAALVIAYFLIMLIFRIGLENKGFTTAFILRHYRKLGLNVVFSGPLYIYPILLQSVYMDDLQYRPSARISAKRLGLVRYILVKLLMLSLLSFIFYFLLSAAYLLPLWQTLASAPNTAFFLRREARIVLQMDFIRCSSLIISVAFAAVFAFRYRQRILPYAAALMVIYFLPSLVVMIYGAALPEGKTSVHLYNLFFSEVLNVFTDKSLSADFRFLRRSALLLFLILLSQYLMLRKQTARPQARGGKA